MASKTTILATLLSAAAGVVRAADCWNPDGGAFHYYNNLYNDAWGARNAMCGGNLEYYQAGNVRSQRLGPDSASCWGALDNIINQCIYSEEKNYGVWHLGDTSYVMFI